MTPRRIEVLYTGGTIGMAPGPHGFEPAPGLLARTLARSPRFHAGSPDDDPAQGLILPSDNGEDTVHYAIHEYTPLLDSANMGIDDWVALAQDIVDRHDHADAFVILHGTDTMAYTASALSFMLEGSHKPVILTGSQIPLCRVRNDAEDNLLGALTLAARGDVREVSIYFHHHLYRGNRSRKVDSDGLDAFSSGYLRPLARVGVDVDIDTSVLRPEPTAPLRLTPITERHVIAIRWFPGLTAAALEALLQPPLQGVVFETYGAGNVPHRRTDLIDVLRRAHERGVVLTHVTQCVRGHVHPTYAAGRILTQTGVLAGEDMTAECALVKLAWLLSQPGLSRDDVRRGFVSNLRGELTPSPTSLTP